MVFGMVLNVSEICILRAILCQREAAVAAAEQRRLPYLRVVLVVGYGVVEHKLNVALEPLVVGTIFALLQFTFYRAQVHRVGNHLRCSRRFNRKQPLVTNVSAAPAGR